MFELKREVPKAKPAKEQSSVHWGQAGSAGLVEAKAGRGLRPGQACDRGCSQRGGAALCQPLPAPPRAQSHMRGGGGGGSLPAHTSSPSQGRTWTPQDSQPPVPTAVPVPSLPCPSAQITLLVSLLQSSAPRGGFPVPAPGPRSV